MAPVDPLAAATNPALALTYPISSYNASVAQKEAAANPSNAPSASIDDLNSALATAQQNGVDLGTIQALWLGGANALQLQLAASSPAQAAAALAPGGALQSITGVTPAAGEPVTSSLLYPAADTPQYDTSPAAQVASAIYGSPTGSQPDWCSTDSLGLGLTNCVYLLIGGGAVLVLWLWSRRR